MDWGYEMTSRGKFVLASTTIFAAIFASMASSDNLTTTSPCPRFSLGFTPISGRAPLAVAVTGYVRKTITYYLDFGDGYRVSGSRSLEEFSDTLWLDQTHIYDCPGVYVITYGGFAGGFVCDYTGETIEVSEPTFVLNQLRIDRTVQLACNDDINVSQISQAVVDWGDGTAPENFIWVPQGNQYVAPTHSFASDGEYKIKVTNSYDGVQCSFDQEASIVVNVGAVPTQSVTWGRVKAIHGE